MTNKNTIDAFISYSHKDKPIADLVCSGLEGKKIKCWYAPRDIPPGESWGGAIIKAISSAKLLILVFTSNSNESDQVLREVERAISKKIKVIPFRVENKNPSADLEYFISTCQWIDAFVHSIEVHINELLKVVENLLPPPQTISYSKGAIYKWWEVIDSGNHGEDVELKCRNCNVVKSYDIIFNEHPPDTCPVCSFDGEKKSNITWYFIQAGGAWGKDIRCKKCRDLISVSPYESDYKIPESCPSCHFSG